MKNINIILLLVLSIFFCGCGTIYQSRKDNLWKNENPEEWGAQPSQEHKEIEKKLILSMLKDPSSAQFQWNKLKRNIIQQSIASPTPVLIWQSVNYVKLYFCWKSGS